MPAAPLTHFLMIPLRNSSIHQSMTEFCNIHNLQNTLDPHVTLALFSCADENDLNYIRSKMDNLKIPRMNIKSQGLVCISPQATGPAKKNRLKSDFYNNQLPKGQLLADIACIPDILNSIVFRKSFWAPIKTIFQRELHATFSETKGICKTRILEFKQQDQENIDFGEIEASELHLCLFNSIDGIYSVIHKIQLQKQK